MLGVEQKASAEESVSIPKVEAPQTNPGGIAPCEQRTDLVAPSQQSTSSVAPCYKRTSSHYCYIDTNTNVLLQTATATVTNVEQTHAVRTRVLLDLGSQKSYCTLQVKEALNLPTLKKEWLMIKTFGDANPTLRECHSVQLRIEGIEGTSLYVNLFAVEKICSPISNQTIELTKETYPHLRDLNLADNPEGKTELEVHILLGADYYWNIVSNESIRGYLGEPVATNSRLGWLLSGPSATGGAQHQSVNLSATHVLKIECAEIKPLDEQVAQFWELDSIGVSENEPTVYETFVESIKHDGIRYEVKLPWKPSHPILPDNFSLSLGRLQSLSKRLRKNPDVFNQYNEIILEQESEGVIERVNDIEHSKSQVGKINYLPHREVIKEERSTTKIRVVYDGSAKLKNSVSLNNCLYKGPSLVPLLYDVLLRFRIFPIAITADIARAFLNISIAEEDRDSLRFLWLENHEDKNSEITVFRFARLPFGLNCSPFLLQGTLEHHLKKHEPIDPELIHKILKSLYVDDLNSGTSSVKEGYELYEKVKGLMLQAGMNMRKWRTNTRN